MSKLKDHFISAAAGAGIVGAATAAGAIVVGAVASTAVNAGIVGAATAAGAVVVGAVASAIAGAGAGTIVAPKPFTAALASMATMATLFAAANFGLPESQKPADEPTTGVPEAALVVEGTTCKHYGTLQHYDGKTFEFILPAGCKFKSAM